MPLSKRYLDTQEQETPLDADGITKLLDVDYPQIDFALVLGSATGGVIGAHSDLDVAICCNEPLSFQQRVSLVGAIEDLHRGVRCDLGILNGAEPVYRFEALKGYLLAVRDQESWLRFYSVTCREYESQMFHYDRQRRYRLEARPNEQGIEAS
jgi:predicted nucleotidyltransferase